MNSNISPLRISVTKKGPPPFGALNWIPFSCISLPTSLLFPLKVSPYPFNPKHKGEKANRNSHSPVIHSPPESANGCTEWRPSAQFFELVSAAGLILKLPAKELVLVQGACRWSVEVLFQVTNLAPFLPQLCLFSLRLSRSVPRVRVELFKARGLYKNQCQEAGSSQVWQLEVSYFTFTRNSNPLSFKGRLERIARKAEFLPAGLCLSLELAGLENTGAFSLNFTGERNL